MAFVFFLSRSLSLYIYRMICSNQFNSINRVDRTDPIGSTKATESSLRALRNVAMTVPSDAVA